MWRLLAGHILVNLFGGGVGRVSFAVEISFSFIRQSGGVFGGVVFGTFLEKGAGSLYISLSGTSCGGTPSVMVLRSTFW